MYFLEYLKMYAKQCPVFFEILMTVTEMITVLWDVICFSLVVQRNILSPSSGLKGKPRGLQTYSAFCFLCLLFDPEDGDSTASDVSVNLYRLCIVTSQKTVFFLFSLSSSFLVSVLFDV
jgi:hypothetical protein